MPTARWLWATLVPLALFFAHITYATIGRSALMPVQAASLLGTMLVAAATIAFVMHLRALDRRRADRDRAEAPTSPILVYRIYTPPPVMTLEGGLDSYARGYADGLARVPMSG